MDFWTFSSLPYSRPDFDVYRNKCQKLTEKLQNASDYETAKAVLFEMSQYTHPVETNYTIAMIRNTLNTTDPFYEKELAYLDEQYPKIQPDILAFSEAVYHSSFRREFEKEFGKQMFVRIESARKSFCKKNIPLMQLENRLLSEYQKILATCEISFDGQVLNLPGIEKYFEDDNRQKRKEAYLAYAAFFEKSEKKLEDIWNELIRIRNEMGRNLGFENFIPLGYLRQECTDYGVQEVNSFRKQVLDELVPLCSELYLAQSRRLGIDRIRAWDEARIFPDGNAHPTGDDDMIRCAREMYHELSPETAEFIEFMFTHELMDRKNLPGKAVTGYMCNLPSYKAPFVFSCFNGTTEDMEVLTHELGHAFAVYEAMHSQILPDYWSESTDISELHSMTMEQFAYPYAEKFFRNEADKFRYAHLQNAITFVPFGVAVDEFQHICYECPEMSPKERTLIWRRLERKYMPWRDYGDNDFLNRGGLWYQKLYICLYPMYYINHALTTIGAMEFKQKIQENPHNAWRDYLTLCRVGGSLGYLDTLKAAHLSNPFEKDSVRKACSLAVRILRESIG